MAESARFFHSLHSGFARWLNAKRERLGPVFAERYRSLIFEGETAAALLAYLHNNPVRANVVGDPADSEWTSHRAYLGLEKAPPWLDVKRGLELCGFAPNSDGRWRFHEFVRSLAGEPRNPAFTADDAERRRSLARAQLGPVELATPTVCVDEQRLVTRHRIISPGLLPRRGPRIRIDRVLAAVSETTDVDVDLIRSRARTRHIVAARRLALVVWHQGLGQPRVEMARALGIGESAASQLVGGTTRDIRLCAQLLIERLSWGRPPETKELKTVPKQLKK